MDVEIIVKKKMNGEELTNDEIKYMVANYIREGISDEKMTQFLKAICLNGMTDKETFYLTDIMLNSGDKIDLSFIDDIKVDKHSTGAVGDKTTLVVAPIVASAGVPVLKMSGRSLGHTGGTIDKLESIVDFNVNLSNEDFIKQAKEIGIVITAQTGNLVPADKKIYALRDVTNTVNSIPLIASSIMSKKLASGADKIVIDVKVGAGAFMKTREEATKLAKLMVSIGKQAGKEVICFLTNADYPIGYTVGNAIEVLEAIDTLNGYGEPRFLELCLTLSSIMISVGKNIPLEDARILAMDKLNNKEAYNKFLELINYQQGNSNKISISTKIIDIKSRKTGYISDIDPLKISKVVFDIGAGRHKKEDKIDLTVGIKFHKVVGDHVNYGDVIATLYYNNIKPTVDEALEAIKIDDERNYYEIIIDMIN